MITLIGATGFTGQLVARQLAERKANVRLAARNEKNLASLKSHLQHDFECMQVDCRDRSAIGRALDGAQVVINCVGPFSELGEPVVSEAASKGIHYLDTTGEQCFIKLVFDRFGAQAKASGCALVPACAFEYAIGDAAAAMFLSERQEQTDSIDIIYDMRGLYASRGTKKSVVRALAAPALQLRDGRLIPITRGEVVRDIAIPNVGQMNAFPFPGGEVLMVPLHHSVKAVTILMTSSLPAPILALLSQLGPLISTSALAGNLISMIDRGAFGPTEEKRKSTEFTLLCKSSTNGGDFVMAKGHDPYLLTAIIVADLAMHLDSTKVATGRFS